MRTVLRVALTLIVVGLAIIAGYSLWHHYMVAPWTRDARIRADIVTIAPDVSGRVTSLKVRDNQLVEAGQVLLSIDRERYQAELEQARAVAETRAQQARLREHEASRRSLLGQSISAEQKENSQISAAIARSEYHEALAQLKTAELNMQRTEVHAPRAGQITNLRLAEGNYASAGQPVMALVAADSFYVQAYFEETKLPNIHPGDAVRIWPMSTGEGLTGTVESISQGITDRNASPDSQLLADVEPTFNWVRLAQRIPVRIRLDPLPAGIRLSAGMTASVQVQQQ